MSPFIQKAPMMNTALLTSNLLASSNLSTSFQSSNHSQLCPSNPVNTSKIQGSPVQKLDSNLTLLQGVVEGLPDGIMILTDRGELSYGNSCARRICRQLAPNAEAVPSQIWRCCQALIGTGREFHQTVIVEDEILTEDGITIRIRVRWLDPNNIEFPCVLVTLEDQQQSAQYRAYAEAHRYGLTDRETEVWLLKRIGLTYKAIAAKLHIAEDTVKKHIKNIHARRDAAQWANG